VVWRERCVTSSARAGATAATPPRHPRQLLTLLVLDLLLHILDGVGRLHLEGDRLAREGLHKDLHLCLLRGSERLWACVSGVHAGKDAAARTAVRQQRPHVGLHTLPHPPPARPLLLVCAADMPSGCCVPLPHHHRL
jgi:hypothetical protein